MRLKTGRKKGKRLFGAIQRHQTQITLPLFRGSGSFWSSRHLVPESRCPDGGVASTPFVILFLSEQMGCYLIW